MYPKCFCGCGKEMMPASYSSEDYPEANRRYWLCKTCGNEVDLGPVDDDGNVVPPITYAPEYIDQMSEPKLKAHYKDMTKWALNIFSLISHWYMTHYEDETQFPDEERAKARFDLLRAVGVEDQFMNLPPVEWRKKGDEQ